MKKSLLTILCTLLSMFSWAQGTTAGDGSTGPFDVKVTVYGNGEVSVGNLPDVIVDGKSAVASVDAGGSLEMFFFPGEGYQLDSLMVDGINVTADVVPATEQSAASYTG